MKNNQYIRQAQHKKGFVNFTLIAVILAVVAIGGYFALKAKQKLVVQPVPATSTGEMANWKTYTNSQYGFEIKYPNNYKLVERKSQITVYSETCATIFNSLADGPWPEDCFSYELLFQKDKISIEGGNTIKTLTQVVGYPAEKIESNEPGMFDGMHQIYVQFEKDSNWYVSFISYNSENKIVAETLLNQILSTFKFTK